MNALTEYGKILRHYRLDNRILLATMAKELDISPAYLSSIETGSRTIPTGLTKKLSEAYEFDHDMRTRLIKAEANTNKSLTIDLQDAPPEAVDVAVMFARQINNLSVKELRKLYEQMHSNKTLEEAQ